MSTTTTEGAAEQSGAEQSAATLLGQVAAAAAAASTTTGTTGTVAEAPASPPEQGQEALAGVITAASALEFLAVGYPSMKAAIEPLITAAKAGATDDVFAKAVITGLQAKTLVTGVIQPKAETNAVQQPSKAGEPSAEALAALNPTAIYAGHNKALGAKR